MNIEIDKLICYRKIYMDMKKRGANIDDLENMGQAILLQRKIVDMHWKLR